MGHQSEPRRTGQDRAGCKARSGLARRHSAPPEPHGCLRSRSAPPRHFSLKGLKLAVARVDRQLAFLGGEEGDATMLGICFVGRSVDAGQPASRWVCWWSSWCRWWPRCDLSWGGGFGLGGLVDCLAGGVASSALRQALKLCEPVSVGKLVVCPTTTRSPGPPEAAPNPGRRLKQGASWGLQGAHVLLPSCCMAPDSLRIGVAHASRS